MKETFRPIANHTTGTCGYYISNLGNVVKFSAGSNGEIETLHCSTPINNSGYHYFNADGDRLFVSRTVWETFCGEIPEGYTVDHIDRNKDRNTLDNLRLLTQQQQSYNKEIPMTPRKLYCSEDKKQWWFNMYCIGKKMSTPKYETPEDALQGYLEFRKVKEQRYLDFLSSL